MAEHLLILANFFVCSIGGWLCICRMTKMSYRETKLVIRWQYSLLFSFFAASGWSFLFGDWPTPIQLFQSAVIVSYVFMGVPAWKDGAPEYTRR